MHARFFLLAVNEFTGYIPFVVHSMLPPIFLRCFTFNSVTPFGVCCIKKLINVKQNLATLFIDVWSMDSEINFITCLMY